MRSTRPVNVATTMSSGVGRRAGICSPQGVSIRVSSSTVFARRRGAGAPSRRRSCRPWRRHRSGTGRRGWALAHQLEVARGHVLDTGERLLAVFEAARAQAVHGLVLAESPGQGEEGVDVAAHLVDQEQRPPAVARPGEAPGRKTGQTLGRLRRSARPGPRPVEASSRKPTGSSTSSASRRREPSWTAMSELPPRSKKSS